MAIEENLNDLLSLLAEGQFVQAQEKYLADNVTLVERDDTPKTGKENVIELEKQALVGVREFVRYEAFNIAVNGNFSFYKGVMEYVQNDGKYVRVEQAVVDRWEDGKIAEGFYHM